MLTEAWKSLLIVKSEAMLNINPSFVSSRLRETTAVHGFAVEKGEVCSLETGTAA